MEEKEERMCGRVARERRGKGEEEEMIRRLDEEEVGWGREEGVGR